MANVYIYGNGKNKNWHKSDIINPMIIFYEFYRNIVILCHPQVERTLLEGSAGISVHLMR